MQKSEPDDVEHQESADVCDTRDAGIVLPQHTQIHGDQVDSGQRNRRPRCPSLGHATEPDLHALLHHQPDIPPNDDDSHHTYGGTHLHEHIDIFR